MASVLNLDDWLLPTATQPADVSVVLTVHIKTDIEALRSIDDPKQRRSHASHQRKKAIELFAQQFNIKQYDVSHQHYAITFKTSLPLVNQMADNESVDRVTVREVTPGIKRESSRPINYFCLKVQFIIQVEGYTKGLQEVDEQHVLVKATSPEDARQKIQPYINKYETPYINSDGAWVLWKFDRVLDCFETIASTESDFKPEGVEVFSEIKRRRMKSNDYWDGKW
ncbi:DUF4288 domain-containing protein [Spirosoma soli]|uniref:DUF4288 domain-containing protein n=1 Tax=Spirosoma soli TaxID=1770529 RepID=A0ABW5M555_9BACT